jgi:hypothetical protein
MKLTNPVAASLQPIDVFVGDLKTGRQLHHFSRKGNVEFEFSPDSRLLAVANGQGIGLWETATWKPVGTIPLPPGSGSEVRRPCATALTISPDARLIATGHPDGTILMWGTDLGHLRQPVAADQAARLWDTLAGDDATRAYTAGWQLVGSPEVALRLLRDHLKPVEPVAEDAVKRLVAKLGDDEFKTREAAQKELEAFGDRATGTVRELLKTDLTPEQRQRMGAVLAAPQPSQPPKGNTLRGVRAVAVLERIGSQEARGVLEKLKAGATDARLTREAREALERLGTRCHVVSSSSEGAALMRTILVNTTTLILEVTIRRVAWVSHILRVTCDNQPLQPATHPAGRVAPHIRVRRPSKIRCIDQ